MSDQPPTVEAMLAQLNELTGKINAHLAQPAAAPAAPPQTPGRISAMSLQDQIAAALATTRPPVSGGYAPGAPARVDDTGVTLLSMSPDDRARIVADKGPAYFAARLRKEMRHVRVKVRG